MTTAVLAAADAAGGFSWKTLLTFVGAAILLAFFSSLGIIARLRDRRIQDRRDAAERERRHATEAQRQATEAQRQATEAQRPATAGEPGDAPGPPSP